MKKARIALCSSDEVYISRLHGYLKERMGLPADIADYHDASCLLQAERDRQSAVLILDEREGNEEILSVFPRILLLTEEEASCEKETDGRTLYVRSRYTKASLILDAVLALLASGGERFDQAENVRARIIGYYSPLKRCMQTSMAIASGQVLSETCRALYLNFSPFAPEDLRTGTGDLADLLYYHDCAKEQFAVWLARLKKKIGTLDFVPAAASFVKTAGVAGEDWVKMLAAIAGTDTSDVLLLDLSDAFSGLFDILRICDEIYTITGCDAFDRQKITAYKQHLVMQEEEEILQRTRFCALPQACPLPVRRTALSHGTLARYLRTEHLLPEVSL